MVAIDSDTKGRVIVAGDAIKYLKEAIVRQSDLLFGAAGDSAETIGRILRETDRIIPGHFPELVKGTEGFVAQESAEITLIVR